MFSKLSYEAKNGLKAGTTVVTAIGALAALGTGAVIALKPHQIGQTRAVTTQQGQTFKAIVNAACIAQGLEFDQRASEQASTIMRGGTRISPVYDKLQVGDTIVISCQTLGIDQMNGHNPIADLAPYILPNNKIQ